MTRPQSQSPRTASSAWFLWAAWAYVALTLVLAFVLTRPLSGKQAGGGSDGGAD